MPSLPTGTVTFLFTDIEGSTALLHRLGDRRYAEILEGHRRILRAAIQEHGGQEVDSQGDALFAVFPSAQEAVTAAVAAQRALKAHPWPPDASVQVRMGLHTGEARLEAGYVGIDVHQAARVCAAAHGGQILLSDTTRGLVADTSGAALTLRDLGRHRLKGLPGVERLFQVVTGGLPAEFPAPKSLDALPNSLPRQLMRLIGRPDGQTTATPVRAAGRHPLVWVAAFLVIAVAAVAMWRVGLIPTPLIARPNAGAAPRLSFIVLPFASLGKETEQGFTDAIVQDLTTDLSRISGSFVIAWTTAARYKDRAVDPKEIGRDLSVRYVLEGSVERVGNQVRINVQLIDATTSSHLWADRFDRPMGDVLTAQDEITARIANTLGRELVRIEAQRSERNRTTPEAVDYLIRARALGGGSGLKERYRQQQQLLEQALQLDARFPAAMTALASVLASKALDVDDRPEAEADLRRADGLVAKVLAIDPNDSNGHLAKGEIARARAQELLMPDQFQAAITEYETVLSLDPNNVGAARPLARAEILTGEPAQAIPLLEKTLRIDPRGPNIGVTYYRLGLAHLLLGHADPAVEWYRKAITAGYYVCPACAYVELAAALGLKGDKSGARAALAEFRKVYPNQTTIAKIKSADLALTIPKAAALREHTFYKGLRQAGVPEK